MSGSSKGNVIIIGAGVGGLAAAIRLAVAGARVRVFERNREPGGKLNSINTDGFTFDTGPSLLTMPQVARDLFATAGAQMDDALDLIPLDPICHYVYPDGVIFDAPANLDHMAAALSTFSDHDAAGFRTFIDYGRRVYDLTAGPFLFDALGSPLQIAGQFARRLNRPGDLGRVLAPISLDGLVRRHFADPHVRQLFDRYATYNGSSPYLSPALYAIIPFVEYSFGAWYPRGGMYQIARALVGLAERVGVEILTEAAVESIWCKDGRAAGVQLIDGTTVASDLVISNVDVATTYHDLLRSADRSQQVVSRIDRLEPSLSGYVLLLGTNRRYDQIQHHNVFFSGDYHAEFAEICSERVAPRDPTIYVCATSRTDPTQAPPGGENLFILVNAPALSPAYDWRAERDRYRDLVLAKLERMGLPDLRQHIVVERIITPDDLRARYGAQRGAIYGFSSNSRFAPFERPQNRARDIRNLYFVGGSTHPGGGLPLVMLSGKIVADLVTRDMGW